ncbi:MAG: hypothetical protein M3Q51_02650 [Pseudomonadota bacterium]|nr:hypothetical protein [Pseudomonadota bacterium]
MNSTNTPLRARTALSHGLRGALQWRLWLLWIIVTGACAVIGAMPLWNWLGEVLDHSLLAGAVGSGKAPAVLLEAFMSRDTPPLAGGLQVATVLMLLLSPFLTGAAVAAARSPVLLGFGDLVRGGISEYGPMLRMLLWSVIPLGIAIAAATGIMAANESMHEGAVLASEMDTWRRVAWVVGGILFVMVHASFEAGRGWLAADGRLRSAFKAWRQGQKLLQVRPIAVLTVYLVTTLAGLLVAVLLIALRQQMDANSGLGFVLAILAGLGIAAVLAASRIARLFGMHSLAQDMHARR